MTCVKQSKIWWRRQKRPVSRRGDLPDWQREKRLESQKEKRLESQKAEHPDLLRENLQELQRVKSKRWQNWCVMVF